VASHATGFGHDFFAGSGLRTQAQERGAAEQHDLTGFHFVDPFLKEAPRPLVIEVEVKFD